MTGEDDVEQRCPVEQLPVIEELGPDTGLPTSARWQSWWSRSRRTKASMTPIGSLSGSQRDTWTLSGLPLGTGRPTRVMPAVRWIRRTFSMASIDASRSDDERSPFAPVTVYEVVDDKLFRQGLLAGWATVSGAFSNYGCGSREI